MKSIIAGFLGFIVLYSGAVNASCPDFLNHSMRKLASKEHVNFCESYQGQTLLIVNTASNCGYAHQFEELEELHSRYKDHNFSVLAFSSDDFFQEEDEEESAASVCFEKYKVTFPVFATSSVRGSNANPVFKALGSAKGFPRWNFNKYLVLDDGSIAERFKANISPSHPRLKVPVKTALGM